MADGTDWTNLENDAIVADYMAMLADDLAGAPYNKAEHNRALQELIGRGRGSIEFKHQNISAVLKGLGETWIGGYKPAFNFQQSLVDAVVRWLSARPAWHSAASASANAGPIGCVNDLGALWVDAPPTLRNAPPPDETEQLVCIARRFDVAARDERNRALGKAGEERVFYHEKSVLQAHGRDDLAKRVTWVASDEGDGLGYDILSFAPDGTERFIEVKTTNGWERTPFNISRNELAVADERRDHWHLLRLWNFSRSPKAFELRPPLDRHVTLTATSFIGSFE